jgi:acetylornithine/N-succinyldiaminopimelate aminotransferase
VTLADVQALERDYVMPTYARLPVEFVRGEGTRLWDAEGNEYLDFLAGISVSQIGHCHPALVEAITEQAGRLIHVPNLYYSEPGMRLARRLSERSLGGKVFFCNSGAEATECAIKLARKRRPGGGFVVLEGAFHGRTMGALAATPQEAKQQPFAPLVPGFEVMPRDDPRALERATGEGTAAVLLEPIQGETGVNVVPEDTIAAARAACDRTGALLVFDEVQCGMGRTGTLWAWEGLDVLPDVMTLAKGLGGGVPIGACVTSPEFADVLEPGEHGSTFAGAPLVTAAAHAVLDLVDDEEFLAEVSVKGERLRRGLEHLGVSGLRGRGLMLAFDVAGAPELSRRALLEQRLVVNATGPRTLRLLPPLTVTADEIDEAVRRLAAVLG